MSEMCVRLLLYVTARSVILQLSYKVPSASDASTSEGLCAINQETLAFDLEVRTNCRPDDQPERICSIFTTQRLFASVAKSYGQAPSRTLDWAPSSVLSGRISSRTWAATAPHAGSQRPSAQLGTWARPYASAAGASPASCVPARRVAGLRRRPLLRGGETGMLPRLLYSAIWVLFWVTLQVLALLCRSGQPCQRNRPRVVPPRADRAAAGPCPGSTREPARPRCLHSASGSTHGACARFNEAHRLRTPVLSPTISSRSLALPLRENKEAVRGSGGTGKV